MKKFLISAVLIAIGCISVPAQNRILNNPDNKPYFGLRIGADISCPGKLSADNLALDIFKCGPGIEFGGVFNVPVVANFYIEPGLKLFYDTYSFKKGFIDWLFPGNTIFGVSERKFGMRIPVMLGYHFDFTKDVKVSIFTGPELEIGFIAKECATDNNMEVSEDLYGNKGSLNRVNFLWGFGAGVSYQHVYFGVHGGIGTLNMLKNSYANFHESRVSFNLRYNF